MSGFDPDRFSRLDSPLHNWEARTRLISLFILIISIVIAGDIIHALAGLAISILLVLISGLPLSQAVSFYEMAFYLPPANAPNPPHNHICRALP